MQTRTTRSQFATPGLPARMRNFRFFALPEGAAGAGAPAASGGQPASSESEDSGFKSEHSKQTVLSDLAKERDARKALETTISDMQKTQKDQMSAIATAFGVSPDAKDADGAQLLATLQGQVAGIQHESLVYRIAAHHKLTEDDDIDLLKSAKDEEVMTKLAVRLALQSDGTPPTPKPDSSQGGKGEPPKSEPLPGVARMAQAFEDELSNK